MVYNEPPGVGGPSGKGSSCKRASDMRTPMATVDADTVSRSRAAGLLMGVMDLKARGVFEECSRCDL